MSSKDYQYSIQNFNDADVKIRNNQVLANEAIQHSLILNPKKKNLISENKSGIEHSLIALKFNIGGDFVEVSVSESRSNFLLD